jgi:hypothetical protein
MQEEPAVRITYNRSAKRVLASLSTLAMAGCDACEPWPEPDLSTTPSIEYVVAIPNELEIQVDNPLRDLTVRVIGRAYDTNRNPVLSAPLVFAITPAGSGVDLTGTTNNATQVVVRATSSPADQEYTLTVKHVASGIAPLEVPVHVRYTSADHGVAVPVVSVSEWPMAGLASGEVSGAWLRSMKGFVRRAPFGRFNPTGIAPVGDIASGTVLSPTHTVWREESPWAMPPNTMTVPDAVQSAPAEINLVPIFLADNTPGPTGTALPSEQFLIDLQGGADIIETSLVGAIVTIAPVKIPGNKLTWDPDCKVLGTNLNSLDVSLRPHKLRLMVYMVQRGTGPIVEKPYECDPTLFSGTHDAHAIFLPVGVVESQSVAHEIGHALSLSHGSWSAGFFHSNLMVEAQTGMGALRDRISAGQAFRAGLHQQSWLVMAGKNKTGSLNCVTSNVRCPKVSADIVARMPP